MAIFSNECHFDMTFDLLNFVGDENLRKVKTEPHIYLLRRFRNAKEIENRSSINK